MLDFSEIEKSTANSLLRNNSIPEHAQKLSPLRVRATNMCNAKCGFCHNENESFCAPFGFLDISTLERSLNNLSCQVKSIAITGGEPLLHPAIATIAKICHNFTSHNVHINTNGYLISQKLSQLIHSGVTHYHINLNTLDPQEYINNYGLISLRNTLNGIELLRSLHLHVTINYVFTSSRTISDIIIFIQFCINNDLFLTVIEPFSYNSPESGLKFQRIMFLQLKQIGFIVSSIHAGRVIYQKDDYKICIAAPCAPALAWNGWANDDAIVLSHDGNLTRFTYEY